MEIITPSQEAEMERPVARTAEFITIEPMEGYDIVDAVIDVWDVFEQSPEAIVSCSLHGTIFTMSASTTLESLITRYIDIFYSKDEETKRKAEIFFITRLEFYRTARILKQQNILFHRQGEVH